MLYDARLNIGKFLTRLFIFELVDGTEAGGAAGAGETGKELILRCKILTSYPKISFCIHSAWELHFKLNILL